MMIQVLPKIVLWVVLIGMAYAVFGPQTFNSSGSGNPLNGSPSQLYLPPAKPERLIVYEQRLSLGTLQPEEFSAYQALSRKHQASFWDGQDKTVEEALSGVTQDRGDYLAAILDERGLSKEEQSIFFTVLKRDHPGLLEDRE
jgi:hypothetical protein